MKPHRKPILVDLYCCAGGATDGYKRAGFYVIGVDKDRQPNYIGDQFIQADAIEFMRDNVLSYAIRPVAVHASPPCQARTPAQKLRGNVHPEMIGPTREVLREAGLPYVIENVPTTGEDTDPLIDPIMLCGTMFGLRLYRHRLFELSGFDCPEPLHGQHWLKQVKMGRKPGADHILQPVGNFSGVAEAREAMEMPWATRNEIAEAVPPSYTEHIGHYLLAHLQQEAKAA